MRKKRFLIVAAVVLVLVAIIVVRAESNPCEAAVRDWMGACYLRHDGQINAPGFSITEIARDSGRSDSDVEQFLSGGCRLNGYLVRPDIRINGIDVLSVSCEGFSIVCGTIEQELAGSKSREHERFMCRDGRVVGIAGLTGAASPTACGGCAWP